MSILHVVGGGLAGMTVAWEMAQARNAGFDHYREIVLYESSNRLGGKAGSEATSDMYDENGNPTRLQPPHLWSDHGYHLFPVWYRNVIELMGEVGVDYDRIVVEGEKFAQIPRTLAVNRLNAAPGQQPVVTQKLLIRGKKLVGRKTPGLCVVEAPTHEDTLIAGKKGSALPLIMMVCTLPWLINATGRRLKRQSIKSFLNTRFPLVGFLALPSYQSLVLKALSADTNTMSAYALSKMFRRWTSPYRRIAGASWSSLNASLQSAFIEPFEEALRAAGVVVKKQHVLEELGTRDGGVAFLRFEGGFQVDVEDGDHVVSAVPPNILAKVSSGPLQKAAASMAEQSSTFSGVDIYFPKPLTVPRQHFGFSIDPNDFGGTAYDIRPVWTVDQFVYDEPMVLQLVVPKMDDIAKSGAGAETRLIDHVRGHLDGTFDFDKTKWFVHVNGSSPLSLANVTAYAVRDSLPDIEGLSLAGDFMDSSIEVPSMEGAVGNGRRVAAELLGRKRESGDPNVPWRLFVALWAVVGWILAYAIGIIVSPYLVPRAIYRWVRKLVSGGSGRQSSGSPQGSTPKP